VLAPTGRRAAIRPDFVQQSDLLRRKKDFLGFNLANELLGLLRQKLPTRLVGRRHATVNFVRGKITTSREAAASETFEHVRAKLRPPRSAAYRYGYTTFLIRTSAAPTLRLKDSPHRARKWILYHVHINDLRR